MRTRAVVVAFCSGVAAALLFPTVLRLFGTLFALSILGLLCVAGAILAALSVRKLRL